MLANTDESPALDSPSNFLANETARYKIVRKNQAQETLTQPPSLPSPTTGTIS